MNTKQKEIKFKANILNISKQFYTQSKWGEKTTKSPHKSHWLDTFKSNTERNLNLMQFCLPRNWKVFIVSDYFPSQCGAFFAGQSFLIESISHWTCHSKTALLSPHWLFLMPTTVSPKRGCLQKQTVVILTDLDLWSLPIAWQSKINGHQPLGLTN